MNDTENLLAVCSHTTLRQVHFICNELKCFTLAHLTPPSSISCAAQLSSLRVESTKACWALRA